jgi:hypothetical protein
MVIKSLGEIIGHDDESFKKLSFDEQLNMLENYNQLFSRNLVNVLEISAPHIATFCTAAVNRTLEINRSFLLLCREKLYVGAYTLVRINIDTLIRLHAACIYEHGKSKFILELINNTDLKKLHFFNTENVKTPLQEAKVLEDYNKRFLDTSMSDIYKTGSGFVHLGSSIIKAVCTTSEGKISTHFDSFPHGGFQENIPEAIKAMIYTTLHIGTYIESEYMN